MEAAIEKKPAGLENKSEELKNGTNGNQNGKDKEKKAAIKTVNPATNELVESFQEMTDQEIENAICNAHNTFDEWRKTSYKERGDLLRRVAVLMRQKKDLLAKLITLEMGKLISESEEKLTSVPTL